MPAPASVGSDAGTSQGVIALRLLLQEKVQEKVQLRLDALLFFAEGVDEDGDLLIQASRVQHCVVLLRKENSKGAKAPPV